MTIPHITYIDIYAPHHIITLFSILFYIDKHRKREKDKSREREGRNHSQRMGNSLRCCLACVLPFGAFDLIRVVHLNGQIEEYSAPVTVRQILAVHPNYILTKPSAEQGVSRWIAILSQDTELKRGHIYFLVPSKSASEKSAKQTKRTRKLHSTVLAGTSMGDTASLDLEKDGKVGHHRRMSSRLSDWKPNLECITEDL